MYHSAAPAATVLGLLLAAARLLWLVPLPLSLRSLWGMPGF